MHAVRCMKLYAVNCIFKKKKKKFYIIVALILIKTHITSKSKIQCHSYFSRIMLIVYVRTGSIIIIIIMNVTER